MGLLILGLLLKLLLRYSLASDSCNIDIEADAIISTVNFLQGISGVAEECRIECERYRDNMKKTWRPQPPKILPPYPLPWDVTESRPPMLQPEEIIVREASFIPPPVPTMGFRAVDDALSIHVKKNRTKFKEGKKPPCKGILPPPVLPSASPHDDQSGGVPNTGENNGNPWNPDKRSTVGGSLPSQLGIDKFPFAPPGFPNPIYGQQKAHEVPPAGARPGEIADPFLQKRRPDPRQPTYDYDPPGRRFVPGNKRSGYNRPNEDQRRPSESGRSPHAPYQTYPTTQPSAYKPNYYQPSYDPDNGYETLDRASAYPSKSDPKPVYDPFNRDPFDVQTDPYPDYNSRKDLRGSQGKRDEDNYHPPIYHPSPVVDYKSMDSFIEKPKSPSFREMNELPFDVPESSSPEPVEDSVPVGQLPNYIQYKETDAALPTKSIRYEEQKEATTSSTLNRDKNEDPTPKHKGHALELHGVNHRGNASYRQVLVESRDSAMYPRRHHMRRHPFQFVQPFIYPQRFRSANKPIETKNAKGEETNPEEDKETNPEEPKAENPMDLLKSLEDVENKKKEIDSHLSSIVGKPENHTILNPIDDKDFESVVPVKEYFHKQDESGNIYRVRVDLVKPKNKDVKTQGDGRTSGKEFPQVDEPLDSRAETEPLEKDATRDLDTVAPQANEVLEDANLNMADESDDSNNSPTEKAKERAWTLINLEH